MWYQGDGFGSGPVRKDDCPSSVSASAGAPAGGLKTAGDGGRRGVESSPTANADASKKTVVGAAGAVGYVVFTRRRRWLWLLRKQLPRWGLRLLRWRGDG